MPLNLVDTADQIDGMAGELRSRRKQHALRLENALTALQNFPVDDYSKRLLNGDFGWDAPAILEHPYITHEPASIPSDFTVVAVDGSHIDVDRHLAARCFLINTGSAVLTYGAHPNAELDSEAKLYGNTDDLIIRDPDTGAEQVIEGAVLGAKRMVEEMRQLAKILRSLPSGTPTLALVDGPLVMLGLVGQGYSDYVRQQLLEDGFVKALEDIRDLAKNRLLSIAGYTSLPRYSEVIGALRHGTCGYNDVSSRCGIVESDRATCDTCVGGIQDRELFTKLLGPGERSGLFSTASRVVVNHYRDTEIVFFYVNVGHEIARIEVPSWTAQDDSALSLTHSLIIDQARRGQGYPITLMEAHEKAVISGGDRRYFNDLVDRALQDHDMPVATSEKARSKRLRWL